jgi:hypothetical protein
VAEAWCASAAAWAERLGSSYPGYRDLTQPVALAVHEARRGLAMVAAAADISTPLGRSSAMGSPAAVGIGNDGAASLLEGILTALMAFPLAARGAADGAAVAELASSDAQRLVARLAAVSAVGSQAVLISAAQEQWTLSWPRCNGNAGLIRRRGLSLQSSVLGQVGRYAHMS